MDNIIHFLSEQISCVCPDDTPVASAKAGPGDGSGEADEDGNANNGRLWRTVIIGEQEHRIDMQVIRPYLRVITHGGQSVITHEGLWKMTKHATSQPYHTVQAHNHQDKLLLHCKGHNVIRY